MSLTTLRNEMARGSKPPQSPKRPAVLVIPKDEARAMLQRQIDQGRRVITTPANPLSPTTPSEDDYTRWDKVNSELLWRIFSGDDFFREYDFTHFSAPAAVAYGSSFRRSQMLWQAKVPPRITCLQSIIDRLDLIDAPEASSG